MFNPFSSVLVRLCASTIPPATSVTPSIPSEPTDATAIPCSPLISVDAEEMSKVLDECQKDYVVAFNKVERPDVNRVQTGYNMSDDAREQSAKIREYNHAIWQVGEDRDNKLIQGLVDAVTKIQDDTKVVRDKAEKKRNKNNIVVGDLIQYYNDLGLRRVTRVTKASYWYEYLMPEGKIVTKNQHKDDKCFFTTFCPKARASKSHRSYNRDTALSTR